MAQLNLSSLSKLSLIILVTLTCVAGKHFRTTKLGARNSFLPIKVDPESIVNSQVYEVRNYTQTLDHFNFDTESYATFQQRYIVDNTYWAGPANSTAPIFLYVGAENDIMFDVEYNGFENELASRFKALLVYIEHRYYGTSMPFGSKDEAYKNVSTLGFFTSEQALADYAQVILDVKKHMSAENCPVIAIGASYGGMLASWFRLKYPHAAYGALAISAPVLYFLGLTPENGYDFVVSEDFMITSPSCYNTIKASWDEIDRIGAQPHGLSQLSQIFNTCMPVNTTQDLKYYLESAYDALAQYDIPAGNYLQMFCDAIDGAGEKVYILEKIMAGVRAVFGTECNALYDSAYMGLNKDFGWDWQSCTEMVMPMGRGENDTMFQADPFDLEEYTKDCQEVFGVTPRPYWVPIEFGGYGIKKVLEKFASNIIFSNGLRDPYSSGGVLQNISDTVVAIYTQEGHHCTDILTPMATDPDWLVEQRNTEINIIEGWLSKYTLYR